MMRVIVQQVAGELVDVAVDLEAEQRMALDRMKSNCAGNQCALFVRQKDKAQTLSEISSNLRLRAYQLRRFAGIDEESLTQEKGEVL